MGQNNPGTFKELPGLATALSIRQPTEKDKTGAILIYQVKVDPINHIECLYSMLRPVGRAREQHFQVSL